MVIKIVNNERQVCCEIWDYLWGQDDERRTVKRCKWWALLSLCCETVRPLTTKEVDNYCWFHTHKDMGSISLVFPVFFFFLFVVVNISVVCYCIRLLPGL